MSSSHAAVTTGPAAWERAPQPRARGDIPVARTPICRPPPPPAPSGAPARERAGWGGRGARGGDVGAGRCARAAPGGGVLPAVRRSPALGAPDNGYRTDNHPLGPAQAGKKRRRRGRITLPLACLLVSGVNSSLRLLSQTLFASIGQAPARIIASVTWSLFTSLLTHRLVLLRVVAYCFIFWDLPGDVLAAPKPALCGWIGVIPLSLSLSPLGADGMRVGQAQQQGATTGAPIIGLGGYWIGDGVTSSIY